jgi:hypothetical protein
VTSRGGASPECTELGAPGRDSNGDWVREDHRIMRSQPGATSRSGKAQGGESCGGSRSARQRSPACGVPAAGAGYGLRHLAQKGQERVLVLTEGSNWPEKQRRVAGGEVRAAGRRGACGGGRCRASPGSCTPQVDSRCFCYGATGVREARALPAARNCTGGATHQRQLPGRIPVRHGSGARLQGSRSFPGLRQSHCGVWPGLGCSGAARQQRSRDLRGGARWEWR